MTNSFRGEIPEKALVETVGALLSSTDLRNPQFAVYLQGHGHKPRSFYRQLRLNPTVEVVWSGWSGPWWLWLLSFIPSQAGIVKIKGLDRLKEIYEAISELSMSTIYFVPRTKEEAFLAKILQQKYPLRLKDLFDGESEFFLLNVDYDYSGKGEQNQLYVYCLYGTQTPTSIASSLTQLKTQCTSAKTAPGH